MNAVRGLAASQGFYGRLYERMCEDETIVETLVAQNFRDVVDMVMWIEG